MLRDERDYLLRMIAMAAAIAARLRERLSGDPSQGEEIAREARQAQVELLGKDSGLLSALDAASVKHLVTDKDKIAVWVALLRVEADALRQAGRHAEADARESRARALS